MIDVSKDETGSIPYWGVYIFPVLTIIFATFYLADEQFYRSLIMEDSIVEWLTFTGLVTAGFLSLILAIKIKHNHKYLHWFFILFFAFNLLAGLEEISWGQRVFEIETTGVFQKYSDQNEINLHNTFQGVFHIKTKHIALLVLLFYGGILPGLMRKKDLRNEKFPLQQFIIPPLFLRLGFIIGAILMLDFQTGYEEELGEFFFSICFVFILLWNLELFKRGYFNQDVYSSISKRSPSFNE